MDTYSVRLHRDLPSGPGPDDCHGTVVHVPSGRSEAVRNCAELIEALNRMSIDGSVDRSPVESTVSSSIGLLPGRPEAAGLWRWADRRWLFGAG